ncbi:MAG: hypothetical protein WCX81_04615 [Monoglobales bacterium]
MSKEKICLPTIGMRKIKSVLALLFAFAIWQVVRIFLPQLNIHPLFGYIYAIIEMRDTVQKTKEFGKLRIKATFVGLFVGLSAIPLSVKFGSISVIGVQGVIADLVIIMLGALITLWLAELFKCKNFCGIAAIIFVICMVRDHSSQTNIYVYAILRVFQTLLGVFSAWVVNAFIPRREKCTDKN